MSDGWVPQHVSVAGLRARGWTPTMVTRLLGEPDKTATNPRYRSAAPTRLYLITRVADVETTDAFKAAVEKALKRAAVGRAVADKKRAEHVAEAEALPIRVEHRTADELMRDAIRAYNDRGPKYDRDYEWQPATRGSDPAFLERIQVNFARHNLTIYDEALEVSFARVGVHEAVRVIRRRVYETIAAAWPHLAGECTRQFNARGG